MTGHIPEAARRRHIAILGMNGSGKTSAAKVELAEPALAAGERLCAIDPTGVWWGLRLKRDGQHQGFGIYVIGGERADFPLEHGSGETWAEIVGTTADSFVFDMSKMTVARRTLWFTDFAEALIIKNKGPLNLMLDEAHLFAPQSGGRGGGSEPAMLHASNNLLALGRSKGLRVTMITQRPAKLHKDALTQAHTLVAMMVTAPQDRAAIKDWIADQADPEKGAEIIASLPGLAPGDGWVWAPREKVLELMHFGLPKTFDSSKAPDEMEIDVALPSIDPATITGRLAQVAKDKADNDPARLRAENARLRSEIEQLRVIPAVGDADRAYSDGYAMGWQHGASKQRSQDDAALDQVIEHAKMDRELLSTVVQEIGARAASLRQKAHLSLAVPTQSGSPAGAGQRSTRASDRVPAASPPPRAATSHAANGDAGKLTGPQREMLGALAWWAHQGHHEPTKNQLAAKLGWKVRGSHLKNRLTELRNAGMIVTTTGGATIARTEAGIASSPTPDVGDTVSKSLRAVFTGPQTELFDAFMTMPAGEARRDQLAERLGWEPGGSHLKNRITELMKFGVLRRIASGHFQLEPWVR